MRRKLILVLIFGCLFFLKQDELNALNLLQIFDQAKNNSPALRAAKEKNMAEQQKYYQSLANLLPHISIAGEVARNRYEYLNLPSEPVEYYNNEQCTVEAVQPLINISNWRDFRQAKLHARISNLEYNSTLQDFMMQVAGLYFGVRSANEELRFIQGEKKAIKNRLEQAEQAHKVGVISEVQVHEAKARYDLAIAREIEAKNNIAISKEKLRKMLGKYPAERLSRVKEPMHLHMPGPSDIEYWIQQAGQNNIEITLAEMEVRYKDLDLKKKFSGRYPRLDLVGSYSYSNSDDANFEDEHAVSSVKLELSVPLFEGGAIFSRTKEARYRLHKAKNSLEDKKREIMQKIKQTYYKVTALISRIKALRQAVKSNRKALASRELGLQLGTSTLTEVLDAQGRLYQAQSELSKARHDYLLSLLRLKKAAGALGRDELKEINSLLVSDK